MKYLLFLDYDGTLTPIVDKPSLAVLSVPRRRLLKKASKNRQIKIAVVSGRKLSDLKQKVNIKGIYYAGNHGFEIEGPKVRVIHPKAKKIIPTLVKIKSKLKNALKGISGIIVEDKVLTLSLHYRLAKTKDLKRIDRIFHSVTAPYKSIRATHGKKVYEVRPKVKWDKGQAVLWLIKKIAKKNKAVPIYIGDDVTDEDAFKVLKRKGLTLRVGRSKNSSAQRFLRNVNSVYNFIESLQKMC
ncbi:MAG: trehalose-phosphatase [Candidatus Margulisiibacteriota bacterium]|nr:trehalose-phosphatase [Candidatus Margulisiibacteriota bacterium]